MDPVQLTWPGKRVLRSPAPAPLAVTETTAPVGYAGWRNRLIHSDNLAAMAALMPELCGRFDLIYADPPFATGDGFSVQLPVGEGRAGQLLPIIEADAYSDQWRDGLGGYLQMMYERLALMRELLAESGSIYLHCDWRASAHLRLLMDEVFGRRQFLNEIVWAYGLGGSSRRNWPRKHDTILWYAKRAGRHHFEPDMVPATSQRMRGKLKKCPDVWEIPAINNMATERFEYATQKPLALLERIVRSSCPAGGLVGDFFCGSATTGVAAQALGRRWVMSDSSQWAAHIARKRLLEGAGEDTRSGGGLVDLLERATPFDILRAETDAPDGKVGDRQRLDVAIVTHPSVPGLVRVELRGLGYERPDPITERVRAVAGSWQDLIDYWAVDWEHDGEVFRNCWRAFRTRSRRALPMASQWHERASAPVAVRAFTVMGEEVEGVV